jgi:pimeloyl-ACP methyl ester carboxylesterase
MERISINGTELEYEARGSGEAVLLIHGSIIADAFDPLIAEKSLSDQYRLINYHRRGYAGSSRPTGPVSLIQQAADARTLLQQLGVERAHIVGHSYGGSIALQLALDTPEAVHSLSLLEPGLMTDESAEQMFQVMAPVLQAYQAGDKVAAIDGFVERVAGPESRRRFDRVLPAGWFEQAAADADTFFQIELPAMQQWHFTEEEARRITQPVLDVLGADSGPHFAETQELLRAWLPQREPFVLTNATHGLQIMNPSGMAEALASFFARHPMRVAV